MNESEMLKLFMAVIIGGAATLVGKIIFDWLKNRGAATTPIPNPAANNNWKGGVDKCLVQHKAMIQTHETTIQTHEKRLDKGSEDFKEIRKSIAGLDTSYAVLAERVK